MNKQNKPKLSYLSKTPGIGGHLKDKPEDFLVEEITKEGKVLELDGEYENIGGQGNFTIFVLQKREWNTSQALKEIARKAHVSAKKFDYAGNKDRRAITAQLCSAYKLEKIPEVKDVKISILGKRENKVEMGDLIGNRFTIRTSDANEDEKKCEEKVRQISEELAGGIPNYFGEQRFGSLRSNTHLVGRLIVQGDIRSAVMNYLTFYEGEDKEDAREARKRLEGEQDFAKALEYFPTYLKYERTMLGHLAQNPRDFVNALRKIPRSLALMFVHAYQSYLFNKMLSERIGETTAEEGISKEEGDRMCGSNFYGFPDIEKEGSEFVLGKIIGYESKNLSEQEKKILEIEGMTSENFKIKSFPEISSRGTFRPLLVPLKNFKFEKDKFRFELPAGVYATCALREFMDKKF